MQSRLLLFTLILLISCNNTPVNMQVPENFSWQGHRGARGLLPENTIPAFKKAMDLGMGTLELDIAVSADKQIIVTHEPWMSAEICLDKEGKEMSEATGKNLRIYEMTLEEIALYDCGTKIHPRFSQQEKMAVTKPSLKNMVEAVEAYAKEKNYPLPFYNIEIKSQEEYDDKLSPPVKEFVNLTITEITSLGIRERTNLQSFDVRALEAIHQQAPDIVVAYLTEFELNPVTALEDLTFKPEIYSPYYKFVNKSMINSMKERGIKVIPWTVNETEEMTELVNLGVDGIITDFPNRIPKK